MKFVATKTADQLDLQAMHRVRERLVSQRTGIINQIRAFLLERGIAVRQGQRFLRKELPHLLAAPPEVLSPRMVLIIEGLACDWRQLDTRIEDVSAEIEDLAMVAAIGTAMASRRGATSRLGSGLFPGRYRPGTAPSSARYRSAATATCASCSSKQHGSCL
jgi:transposase